MAVPGETALLNKTIDLLPAIEGHFVEVSRHGAASCAGAVHLDVRDQRAVGPPQILRRQAGGAGEGAVRAIEVHPVVRHIPAAVAMEADLDVVPGVRGPRLRIAGDVRAVPVPAPAVVGPLPRMRVRGALGAEYHRLPI